MKILSINAIALLLLVCSTTASGESISKFSETKSPTTPWRYEPSNVEITSDGIGSEKYPITKLPNEAYIVSEPIAVANYENIGVICSYHVSTQDNHGLMVEMEDLDGNVVFSAVDEDIPNVELAMSISENNIVPTTPIVRFKFRLSDAYNSSEIAHVDEISIFGTLKPWEKCEVSLYDHVISGENVMINWATVTNAVKYNVVYRSVDGGEIVQTVVADAGAKRQSLTLTGLSCDSNYEYWVTAVNNLGVEIKSKKAMFNISAGVDDVVMKEDKIIVSKGGVMIDACEAQMCSIYSLSGQELKHVNLNAGCNHIALPAGTYILNQPRNSRLIVIP